MDFVADQLQDGTRIRILTIVDTFTRECLAADTGYKMKSENVVEALSRIVFQRGTPKRIYCDNGSEFAGRMTDLWAYANKIELAFSRQGKPTDNAYIESFNGSFRDECLNLYCFESLSNAKVKMEAWLEENNESRPHQALNNLSSAEYVASLAT